MRLKNAGKGNFTGPASSTDNAVVRFDGTSGRIGQNCAVVIDDSDNLITSAVIYAGTFDTNISAAGVTLSGTTLSADGTDTDIDISILPKGSAGIILPNAGSAPETTANKLYQTGSRLYFDDLPLGETGEIEVRNNSGAEITRGKAVYASGALGNKLTIGLADNTDADKITVLGIVRADIANNTDGEVALWGSVIGTALEPIDTSSYSPGDKLYLSTSGNWTNVHPTAANNATIIIGIVRYSHASLGEISIHNTPFANGNTFDGTMRQHIINKSTGTSAATGFTAVNDQGYYATVGIGGSNNTTFSNNAVFYGPGYNDNLYACDGNKSHKWFVDPTDSHDNSSLSYLSMELAADGTLTVQRGSVLADGFDTNVAAAGVTLSGTTLSADGTDSNIDITITPKGNAGIVIPNAAGAPSITTNKFYQTGGTLYFGGSEIPVGVIDGGNA